MPVHRGTSRTPVDRSLLACTVRHPGCTRAGKAANRHQALDHVTADAGRAASCVNSAAAHLALRRRAGTAWQRRSRAQPPALAAWARLRLKTVTAAAVEHMAARPKAASGQQPTAGISRRRSGAPRTSRCPPAALQL